MAGGRAPQAGTVVSFDAQRGLGTLEADGGVLVPFHCTAIAGGARTIEVGRRVLFVLSPGHLGRFEGRAVTPLPTGEERTAPASEERTVPVGEEHTVPVGEEHAVPARGEPGTL